MSDKQTYDVVIIGAGIIGANLGFEMSKAPCLWLWSDRQLLCHRPHALFDVGRGSDGL